MFLGSYWEAEAMFSEGIYTIIEYGTFFPEEIVVPATQYNPQMTIPTKFIGTAMQFTDNITGNSISDFERNQAYNAGQLADWHFDRTVEGIGNTADAIQETVNDIMNDVHTGMEAFADPENWGLEDDEW